MLCSLVTDFAIKNNQQKRLSVVDFIRSITCIFVLIAKQLYNFHLNSSFGVFHEQAAAWIMRIQTERVLFKAIHQAAPEDSPL